MSPLTKEDQRSATWLRLLAYLEQRLSEARIENDKDLDRTDTAAVRGRIKELKHMISLGVAEPAIDER
jgi:hypothetical protein